MASDGIDVRYVAKLARLALTDTELEQYGTQLGALLEHVSVLQKLDTDTIAATAQVIEARNVDRDDLVLPGLDHAAVMAGAPDPQHGFFRVPRIIASEG